MEKISNTLNNKVPKLLKILNNYQNEIKENLNHTENPNGIKIKIIPEKIINQIKTEINTKNLSEEHKQAIREFLQKTLTLNKNNLIIFAKGKIYIIYYKPNERRFSGLLEKDIDFLLNEFIKKGFNINELHKNLIKNVIEKYQPKEIAKSYRQILLNEYEELLKEIIVYKIPEKIIKGLAGKLLRKNFSSILKLLTEKLLEKTISEDEKNSIINFSIKEILLNLNFKDNKDFLHINENLSKIYLEKIIKNTQEILQKKQIKIDDHLLVNNFTLAILKKSNKKLFLEIAKHITDYIKQNNNTEGVEKFLYYYNGDIKTYKNKKETYPKLPTSSIKTFINQIKNNKINVEKLANILQQRKKIINL